MTINRLISSAILCIAAVACVLGFVVVGTQLQVMQEVKTASLRLEALKALADIPRHLSPERGLATLALQTIAPGDAGKLSALTEGRKPTEAAIATARSQVAAMSGIVADQVELNASMSTVLQIFTRTRAFTDEQLQLPIDRRGNAAQQITEDSFAINEAVNAMMTSQLRQLASVHGAAFRYADIANTAWDFRDIAGRQAGQLQNFIAAGKPLTDAQRAGLTTFEGRIEQIWARLSPLRSSAATPPAIKTALDAVHKSYIEGFGAEKSRLAQSFATGAFPYDGAVYREKVVPIWSLVIAVRDSGYAAAATEIQTAYDSAWLKMLAAALVMLGIMAVVISVFLLVKRRVTKPLTQMTSVMARMAEGDLSVAVQHSGRKDEIGAMTSALQVFQDNLTRMRGLEAQEREASSRRLAAAESMALVVSDVGEVVAAAAAGDFSARLQIDHADEQMQRLVAGINEINAVVDGATTEFAERLHAIAGGDLTQGIETGYRGRFKDLKDAINETVERLSATVRTIQVTSADVGLAAREINTGADDLSKRTEEQASSLEETAATTEQLAASVKASAQGSRQAAAIATEAMQAAQAGGAIATEAVEAMARIESASQKISDIIRVIDDIAFQTNLLALNAAVEAARAGDAGKGFAVVASEVRTLAQRSSSAAKDISGLIASSNTEVTGGVRLVRQAGDALTQILAASQKVAATIAEISAASGEQANGIDEMSQAVAHLDEMTQANAALAEQSAASAGALSGRIGELNDLVAAFRTGTDASPAAFTASKPAPVRAAPAKFAPANAAPPRVRAANANASASPGHAGSEPGRLRDLAEAAFAQTRAAPRPTAKKTANTRASDSGWEEF